MCEASDLLRDVAAASAAYLVTVLAEYAALDDRERFERIKDHFEAALTAFADGAGGWGITEPSDH